MQKPLWLVAWILAFELLIVLLLVPGDFLRRSLEKETQLVKTYMGDSYYSWMHKKAFRWHRNLLIDNGLLQSVYDHLIPSDAERMRSKGMEKMGRKWFSWVEGRIEALSNTVYAIALRLTLIVGWVPYIGLLFIPSIFDGLMTWRIRQTNFDYVSPVVQTYSIRVMMAIVLALLIALFMPIALHPVIIPLVLIVFCVFSGLSVGNLQKRI